MSIGTWNKEFYPTEPNKTLSRLEAAKHSLRKWKGLTKRNLEKHGIKWDTRAHSTRCALCALHYHTSQPCDTCPIVKLGHANCLKYNSAYSRAEKSQVPTELIKILTDCVTYERLQEEIQKAHTRIVDIRQRISRKYDNINRLIKKTNKTT